MKRPNIPIIVFLFLIYFFASCHEQGQQFIPERHPAIGVSEYETFRLKLLDAYAAEDYYLVAFNLANLRSDTGLIYENLTKAVQLDTTVTACNKIFEVNYLAEQRFYRHIYRMDTLKFKQVLALCLTKKGSDAYAAYRQKEIEETKLYLASREPLDSTQFDWGLIEILKEIDEDDQRLRRKMRSLDISDIEKEELFKRQVLIDSVNLLRVDSVLVNIGYPTREKVGHDYSLVVVMVVHHQSDPAIRTKYLNRIRDYISLEQVEMIERRTKYILEDQ